MKQNYVTVTLCIDSEVCVCVCVFVCVFVIAGRNGE